MTLKEFAETLLATYPPDAQIAIRDADTEWFGDQIHHSLENGVVELRIEYHEMDSKR